MTAFWGILVSVLLVLLILAFMVLLQKQHRPVEKEVIVVENRDWPWWWRSGGWRDSAGPFGWRSGGWRGYDDLPFGWRSWPHGWWGSGSAGGWVHGPRPHGRSGSH